MNAIDSDRTQKEAVAQLHVHSEAEAEAEGRTEVATFGEEQEHTVVREAGRRGEPREVHDLDGEQLPVAPLHALAHHTERVAARTVWCT